MDSRVFSCSLPLAPCPLLLAPSLAPFISPLHQMQELHLSLQGGYRLLIDETGEQRIGVGHRSGRTFASDDIAVFSNQLRGIFSTGEVYLKTGRTGGTSTL